MLLMRFLGLVILLALAVCAGAFLITRDRRYVNWGWQVLRVGGAVTVVFAAMFLLERFLAPMI